MLLTCSTGGEREAIALARLLKAELLIIDERAGTREAKRAGIGVTGTLGVLQTAAKRGLVDLGDALSKLQRTSFHVSPSVLSALLGDLENESRA